MNGDLFGRGKGIGVESPRLYVRKMKRDGDYHIWKTTDPPNKYTGRQDPELLRWMGHHGHSTYDEIPAVHLDPEDLDQCERCGADGVQVHHTAPREWFGDELCEQWPTQDLCRDCHALWHQISNLAAARATVRILRSKGLHRTADQVEAGIARDREKARRAVLSMLAQQRDPSKTEPA